MRAESAIVGINNFISGARHYRSQKERRGRGSLFLRELDRKDDSCAIAHDFLRVPPFSSISSTCLSYFSLSSLIPVEDLTPLSLSAVFPFLLDEFNSCRLRMRGRTFNLPRLLPTPGSIRISISMRRHPRKHSFSFFQYHVPPASFLSVASGCVPACDSNHGWRTRRRINLFRPTVLRPEVENYRRNTKTATMSKRAQDR